MTQADLAYAAIWGAVTLYAVLGGADFGAGIWDFVTRMRLPKMERTQLYGALGPVWEANHVWLVFALVLTMTAFPSAFAAITQALWAPLLVAVLGIVFRGASFVFRAYGTDAAPVERGWSAAFGLASMATPMCFGAAAGAIAAGVESAPDGAARLALLRPLPLLAALLAASACAYLAAVYLARESVVRGSDALVTAWRGRGIVAGIVTGALALAGVVVMATSRTFLWEGFRERAWPLVAISAMGAATSFGALWRRRNFTVAASAAAVAVAAITAGWGVAQRPWLLPGAVSTADRAPDAVLSALLWTSAVGTALVAPSLLFLLRLFKSGGR